jgi:hypothetical protein
MQAHKLATRAQISIEEHLHDLETEYSRARPRKNKVDAPLQALKSTLDGAAGFVSVASSLIKKPLQRIAQLVGVAAATSGLG